MMSAVPKTAIPTVTLPSAERVPALGQGTWFFGEERQRRAQEVAALRLGLELGMTLIDTAEMYGNGGAEEVVAQAIQGRRESVFIVSKVLPHHADVRGTIQACEASLRRLQTDRIDLYLLHWRQSIPLAQTLQAFAQLLRDQKIRYWGVSNFDVEDLDELVALPGGDALATNQVLYNLSRRGIEWDLLPWCAARRVPVMAYSPIEQGRVLTHPVLRAIAERHRATPAQIALAWVLRAQAIVIPRTHVLEHVRENRASTDIVLSDRDCAELDRAFVPPRRKRPLEMI
jgi:diketogulonate reductase-like aldo/keto reductase